MSRVLWISREPPDKFGQGGQRRQFYQLAELARAGAEVTVAVPTVSGGLRHGLVLRAAQLVFRRGRVLTRNARLVRSLVSGSVFDSLIVAHAESFELLGLFGAADFRPCLVDFHNVYSRWYRATGEEQKVEYWLPVEREIIRSVDAATVCSESERVALANIGSGLPIAVAGNGIAREEWPDSSLGDRTSPSVAAFGSWWYPPNRDGLAWFLEEVWPLACQHVPEACLFVAGVGEPPLTERPLTGVRSIGRVEDLSSFLGSVRAVVVPVRSGPGTPVKFAEALASGGAVVATPGAAQGYPDAPAWLSDDPSEMAVMLAELLLDRQKAITQGTMARAYAFRHCAWSVQQRPLVSWAMGGSFEPDRF